MKHKSKEKYIMSLSLLPTWEMRWLCWIERELAAEPLINLKNDHVLSLFFTSYT